MGFVFLDYILKKEIMYGVKYKNEFTFDWLFLQGFRPINQI